jgi:hypothetical protein
VGLVRVIRGVRLGWLLVRLPVVALLPATALGQVVVVSPGDSARVVAPPDARLAIPIRGELPPGGGLSLAALQGTLRWPAARLQFDSLRGATGWTATANTDSAAAGRLTFSTFSPSALAASGTMATAWFTTLSSTGGARVTLVPSVAGVEGGTSLLANLVARPLDVCVGQLGRWGDVTDDGSVNVIDAQQIARYSVALSVANLAAVLQRGDVTGDGSVNVIDAQQVARFSVGLSAAARINASGFVIPVPAGISIDPPEQGELTAGRALALSAVPLPTLVQVLPSALVEPVRIRFMPAMSLTSVAASVRVLAAVSLARSMRSTLLMRLKLSGVAPPWLATDVRLSAPLPCAICKLSNPVPPDTRAS